jgi:hypothetical protein
MYRLQLCVVLAGVMLGGGLAGCEDEIARQREVEVDGDEMTEKETIVRERDGAIEIEKRTTEQEVDDGKVERKVERELEVIPKPQE